MEVNPAGLAKIVSTYPPILSAITIFFDYMGYFSRQKVQYWVIYVVIFVVLILLLAPPETPEFIYFAF